MKRKKIEDFFQSPKKLKVEGIDRFEMCPHCRKLVYYKLLDFHSCFTHAPPKSQVLKELPEPIKLIMSTSQSTLYSNFFLEYLGKINKKHTWKYHFDSMPPICSFTSKTHYLRLSKMDPQCIHLTFSTNHIGLKAHFYDCTPRPGFSPGVLKSLLQKSIRRCLRKNSIKVSLQFAVNTG